MLKLPPGQKLDVYNKKMYRTLGTTLANKYPHMLWDIPSTRSKKNKNVQIWVCLYKYKDVCVHICIHTTLDI